MNEAPFQIPGRGWAHLAVLTCECTRDELGKALLGQTLWSEKILGVESFAIEKQDYRNISILLKNKMWSGK